LTERRPKAGASSCLTSRYNIRIFEKERHFHILFEAKTMMPETITQEAVLEKVRTRIGTLDAKAEQAVAQAIAVLNESRQRDAAAQPAEEKFVSANVSLAQYDAWSPEERFQYLNNAKKINANWIRKHLQDLNAAWLMVIDGQVIAHGSSIQYLPQEQEFDRLCEKYGKYPFVFFNPRLFMIEEASAWHRTVDREFFDNQLIAMATDPEIQAELKQIEQEFAITEADDLARA
jgi:hypothetical protein